MEILAKTVVAGELVVVKSESVAIASAPYSEGRVGTDTPMDTGVKDPLLSSWPFVIGISTAVLAISIIIGALLAKLKIKKGIDLYED